MMRYFLLLAYRGTHYCGWQSQPNAPSVQATLEKALSTILGQATGVTGCGRTDTGVHASYYVAHFDAQESLPLTLLHRLNSVLPDDIVIYGIQQMPTEAHARFDAFERSYEYHLSLRKSPFDTETTWFFSQGRQLDFEKMQAVAALFPNYSAFFPFCKTHSGVDSYACTLYRATWVYEETQQRMIFYVSANRFLRGMVRLMVGACLQVGLGKLDWEEVKSALDNQQLLQRSLSVPPQGLFLVDIKYPYSFPDISC